MPSVTLENRIKELSPSLSKRLEQKVSTEINPLTGMPRRIFEAPTEYLRTQEVPEVLSEIEKLKQLKTQPVQMPGFVPPFGGPYAIPKKDYITPFIEKAGIPEIFKSIREMVAPTTPYMRKESERASKEIYDRLKLAITYYASLGGRLGPKGLREDLLRQAEEFAGFGPALIPAAGETGTLALEWGIIYPALFKAIGMGGEAVSKIPRVAKATTAIKKAGGLEKLAKRFPRGYARAVNIAKAIFKGASVGGTIAGLETIGKEMEPGEVLQHVGKRAGLMATVAGTFQVASEIDTALYTRSLRNALIRSSNREFDRLLVSVEAMPKSVAKSAAYKSLVSLKKAELQAIDRIVSSAEAQLLGLKKGKLYQLGQETVENPQRAAERLMKYGLEKVGELPVGVESLKKKLGVTEPFIKMPMTRVAEAIETSREIGRTLKHPSQIARKIAQRIELPEPPSKITTTIPISPEMPEITPTKAVEPRTIPERVEIPPEAEIAPPAPVVEKITEEGLRKGELPKDKALVISGTFYHNTNRQAAESILEEGFKIEDTSGLSEAERGFVEGNLGNGVYLSPDYAENMNFWGGESNVIVNPKRPLRLYSLGSEEGSARPSRRQIDEIRSQGYDGIIVNDPHPHSGGYQVVVFDPQNLQAQNIVEDTDLSGEELAQRKLTPAPAAEKVEKQPWEMTRDEYVATVRGTITPLSKMKLHRDIVREAIQQGKAVPIEVLEKYKGKPWADEVLAKMKPAPKAEQKWTINDVKDFVAWSNYAISGKMPEKAGYLPVWIKEGLVKQGAPRKAGDRLRADYKYSLTPKAIEMLRVEPKEPTGLESKAPPQLGKVPVPSPGLTKAEVEHLGRREQAALRAAQKRGLEVGYKAGYATASEAARAKIFEIRTAEQMTKQLWQDAIDIVQDLVPKENQERFITHIKNLSNLKQTETLRRHIDKLTNRIEKFIQKAELKQSVGEIRKYIKELIKKYRRGETVLGKLQEKYRTPVMKILSEFDISKITEEKEKDLLSLQRFVHRVSKELPSLYEQTERIENPDLDDEIKNLLVMPQGRMRELERINKKYFGDLETEEIEFVHESLKHLIDNHERLATEKGKLEAERMSKDYNDSLHEIAQAAEKGVVKERIILSKIRRFAKDYPASIRTLIRYACGKDCAITEKYLYDDIVLDGLSKVANFIRTCSQKYSQKFTEEDFKELEEQKYTVKIGGKTIKDMPLDNLFSFYMTIISEGNLPAILKSQGMNFEFYKRPKFGLGLKKKIEIRTGEVTLPEIRDVIKIISAHFKELAQAYFDLNNTVHAPQLNKVSLRLFNHELAKDKKHYPRFREIERGPEGQPIDFSTPIEEHGRFLKRTGGSARMNIKPFGEVLINGIFEDASFIGLAEPMKRARTILAGKRWRQSMKDNGHSNELKAITTIFRRQQGLIQPQALVDYMVGPIFSKASQSVLSGRISPLITQAAGIPSAFEVIEPKYFAGIKQFSPSEANEMLENSDVIWLRYRTKGMNFVTGSIAAQDSLMHVLFDKSRFLEKLLVSYEQGDKRSQLGPIYTAAKRKVSAETGLPITSIEVKRQAARLTERALETQGRWDIITRSLYTSDQGVLARSFALFSSATNGQANVFFRACSDYAKGRIDKTTFELRTGGAVSSFTTHVILRKLFRMGMITGLGALAIALGKKPKIKKPLEKDLRKTITETITAPLEILPGGSGFSYVINQTISTVINKKAQPVRSGNLLADLIDQFITSAYWGGRFVSDSITGDKYISGPQEGQLKWKTSAKKFSFEIAKLIAYIKGAPATGPLSELYYPYKDVFEKSEKKGVWW